LGSLSATINKASIVPKIIKTKKSYINGILNYLLILSKFNNSYKVTFSSIHRYTDEVTYV